MIKANCPKCGNGGQFEDRFAGLNARCARCQTRFTIPKPQVADEPTPPPGEEPPPLPEEELLSVEDEESPPVPKKDGMSAIVEVPPPLPTSLPATPSAGAAPKPSVPMAQSVPLINKTKKFAQGVVCALKDHPIIVYSTGTALLVLFVFWMLWPRQGRGKDAETARIDALINQMFINNGFVVDRTRSGADLWTGQCWVDPDPPPAFESSSAGYGTYASFEERLIEDVWNAARAFEGAPITWKGQPKYDEDSDFRFLLALQAHYVRACSYYEQRLRTANRGRANYLKVQFIIMERDHANYIRSQKLVEGILRRVEVLYVGQSSRLGPKAAADFVKTISANFHSFLQEKFQNVKTGAWVYPAADSGWKPGGQFDPTSPNARTVAVGMQEPTPARSPSQVSQNAPMAKPAGNSPEKPKPDVRAAILLKGHNENAGVTCVAFSPDESVVATAADDNTVCLWDTKTGRLLHRLMGYTRDVTDMAFQPDGTCLVTRATRDNMVCLWDVKTGSELRKS